MLSDIAVLCIALTTDRQIVEQGRAEDRAPRDEVFFHPRTRRSRLSGLNQPDPENIISNPSEGKIYESSYLRIVLEHRGAGAFAIAWPEKVHLSARDFRSRRLLKMREFAVLRVSRACYTNVGFT